MAGPLHLAAVVCVAACAGTAPDPPTGPATPSPLAGPEVTARDPNTLVARDFDGRLIRLELFPAHAAVRLLELDERVRARVEKILSERAALMDTTVRDHYEKLVELFSAGQAGDVPEAIRIAIAFTEKLAPLTRRGPVQAELAAALPARERDRLNALVTEYLDAVVAEERAKPGKAGEARFAILAGETLRLWGEQVRLSFERQIVGGDLFFERIIRQLDLRPDQDARVRDRIARFVEETKLNPTKDQQSRFALEVLAWLDPRQQKTLIRLFQQAEGKKSPAADQPAAEAPAGKPDGQ